MYYKGNTDKALPITANVTYTLDGVTDSLENLIGKSGHLTVTVDLTNNETGTVTVNGKERTVVTPLITAVGVIFGQDATNLSAEHGMLESAAKSSVAAFVCLPGVRILWTACCPMTCLLWRIICRTASPWKPMSRT